MPSDKLKASIAGRAYVRPIASTPASTTRFGVVPKDPDIARLQEDLRAAAEVSKSAGQSPFESGQIIEVTFAAGSLSQTIPHQLGGAARGFIVCDKVCNVVVDIVRDDDTTTVPIEASRAATHIKLRATVACKAKIWVWR